MAQNTDGHWMNNEEKIISVLHALMGGQGFLQAKGLVGRIAEKAGINPLEAKIALGKLARQEIVKGISSHGEAFGRVSMTTPAPATKEPTSLVRWGEAMSVCGLADGEMEALSGCHDRLEGFSDSDLRDLAHGLSAMRETQAEVRGMPRFVVSAKYLLGSSKLLGSLPAYSLRSFGIDIDFFPDAVPQIVTAGPNNPQAVLLVENPHAFEEAVAAGCAERLGLVVTFGYGLSRSGEAYGNCLTESVDDADRLVPLVRAGNPPSPRALFMHPRIFFWGDLDREGLRIYASLRKRIPTLRASALYLPMAEAMQKGMSHPYAKATAKEKQGAAKNIPNDALHLVPLCQERGVDQEIVSRTDIASLASYSLEEQVNR